jgi:Ca2+-binding RTX toxin-like protein
MRRVTMMLAAIAVMVALFAGVAYAATIEGSVDPEILLESDLGDTMFGRGGADEVVASAFGPDGFLLQTPRDTDVANGNAGNDAIFVDDGDGRDTANGGSGDDVCFSDPNDELISCEEENPETTVANPLR